MYLPLATIKGGVRVLVVREIEERKRISLVPSRDNPMEPLLLITRAISLDQLGYRKFTT